ncbi:glycosyl hydrolase family 1 domain-containing protein [Phthorimaea operculella]|nr:glycosyl hydrolase family 1 domain-containing protein [Phthorimaea operculella]
MRVRVRRRTCVYALSRVEPEERMSERRWPTAYTGSGRLPVTLQAEPPDCPKNGYCRLLRKFFFLFEDVPWGFNKLLKEVRKLYGNPEVYVTENGWSTAGGLLDDDRITYLRHYLGAMLNAIDDGCKVRAYSAWSLMDNFEWKNGYTQSPAACNEGGTGFDSQ